LNKVSTTFTVWINLSKYASLRRTIAW